MSDYFYVVNQQNGHVLGAQRSEKGELLLLNGESSQQWQWDHKGRLYNKSELFADIAEKKDKPGAEVILWSGNDGSNQKWVVEDGVIKSMLNELALDGSGWKMKMEEPSGEPSQKWDFVSVACWEMYQTLLEDRNPVTEALFWKDVAENKIADVIGCAMETYKMQVKTAIETFSDFAAELDRVVRGTGTTRAIGGTVGIAGAGLIIAGLATAPFTAGVSLGLSIGGVWVSFGAGVTSLTSQAVNFGWDKADKWRLKRRVGPVLNATLRFARFMTLYLQKIENAAQFLAEENQKQKKDSFCCCEIPDEAKLPVKAAWQIYKLVDNTILSVKCAQGAVAVETAAPGIKFVKTFIAAGSTGAKTLTSVFAAGSLIFGAYDLVDGALSVKNGSKTADEFRKAAVKLEQDSKQLIELYNNLRQ